MKKIVITSGGEVLLEGEPEPLMKELSGGDELTLEDISRTFEYLGEQYGNGDVITVDMPGFAEGCGALDGMKTRAAFWLSALLTREGKPRTLPFDTQMKLLTLVQNKMAVHSVKSERTEKLLTFSRTYRSEAAMLMRGEHTPDEAVENILAVMPDTALLRRELTEHPAIAGILNGVRQMARTCADSGLTERTEVIMEEIGI